MDNFGKTFFYQMARATGTELTDKHLEILDYAHQYYKQHQVGPLYHNLYQHSGVDKDELAQMFPNGLLSVYSWVKIPIHTTENSCKPLVAVTVEQPRTVYLDHNSTTYLRVEVKKLLLDFFEQSDNYGNPSSSYPMGRKSYNQVDKARSQIAKALGVKSDTIYFTSCGSESNSLAIKGIAFKYLTPQEGQISRVRGHLITSKIEHSSILETMKYLETLGFEVTYLDVDHEGRVAPQDVAAAIKSNTILVSIMAVNNEVGTINPIKEIGAICHQKGVPLMADACQALGKIPLKPKAMGISLLSFSGHKIYAPKGVAAIYIDPKLSLIPQVHGGEQESGLRSGSENVPYIMAFGLATQLSLKDMATEQRRLADLRTYFIRGLAETGHEFIVNGSKEHHVNNNLSVGFAGVDSGSVLLSLAHIGIMVSSGSACSAGRQESSHVIKAMKVDTDKYGVIRFSFGMQTCKEDLDYTLTCLTEILSKLKE